MLVSLASYSSRRGMAFSAAASHFSDSSDRLTVRMPAVAAPSVSKVSKVRGHLHTYISIHPHRISNAVVKQTPAPPTPARSTRLPLPAS